MTRRPFSRRSLRPRSFRPTVEALEHRVNPVAGDWALLSDPEGYVYHDVNGNGVFDAGESAMGAGWTVYVDTNNNNALDAGETSTTTDATGHYGIILPDGTYSIRVLPQSGFQNDSRPFGTLVRDFASAENGTNPTNYSGLAWANGSLFATFSSSHKMYQIDPQTGAALGPGVTIPGNNIGEITFDGTDFWGAQYGSSGVLIRFNFAGQELQRLTFSGVDCNSVEWDGSALRVLDQNNSHRIYRINPSGSGTIMDYINSPNESVGGLAFDGTYLWVNGRDTDRVFALDPATGAVQRSFAAPGNFAYGLAVHGQYLWLSDNGASRVFQYDLGYGGGRIVTVAGADVTGVDLAVFQLGSISGRVFIDNNQNGAQDTNDGGLSGWRVYVDANANGRYDAWETSAVTDALGNYTLNGLRPQPYSIALDVAGQRLARWSQVAPAGGTFSIALNSGQAIIGKNFANFLDRSEPQRNEWAAVGSGMMNLYTGIVWVENRQAYNFDGASTYAANSPQDGFDDWRLPNLTEAQAAAAAKYGQAFNWPNDGGYSAWWTSVAATGRTHYTVALRDISGYTSTSTNTSTLLADIIRDSGTTIDDGAAGYGASGFSAKNTSGAYQGDQSSASAGTGSKTATWTFTGLEVGATYKIAATWKTAGGSASNAPFKVFDGTTTIATVAVNQQTNPADFAIDTTAWKGLGSFTLTSSMLKVQLSNLANGTVLADAVRIFKVLPSYAPAAPLVAAALPAGATMATIAAREVKPLLAEALRRWKLAGADVSKLGPIDLGVADLGGNILGLASGHTITLDDNAAGWGWFVDRTPGSDSEFRDSRDHGQAGHMDALTVLMHEVGHLLGKEHGTGVMNESLFAGVRELPDEMSPWWGVRVDKR